MKKNKKVVKISILNQKRLLACIAISFLILFLLLIRIAYLQFVIGKDLSTQATANQTSVQEIAPQRGNIFDANGKVLAISAYVDSVSVNPTRLKHSDSSDVDKQFFALKSSEIFELDYQTVLEKLNNNTSSFVLANKVETDKINTFKAWIEETDITSGISIDNTIKRYYPYSTLAANLIGFTGTDHTGLIGLENSLNSTLYGVPGKVITSIDSINGEIPNQQQTYIKAQNGNDVYLTIDINIQSIADKYLEQAVIENKADSGSVIIMKPSTGDILAMSTYPNYDLNAPFTITDAEILENWDTLTSEEKNDAYYEMWNNPAIQSTYEPGSVFKLITAATALEEGIVTTDNKFDFICEGSETVNTVNINCWRYTNPHGYQSLRDAVANSCNPAFIQLGQKIGYKTLYKYYEAFGLRKTTNSHFYGESNSIFHNENAVSNIELATMSFGQRFNVTPIQMISAISAIANDGILMQPRIVKQIKNPDTSVVTTVEPEPIRQVVSKETSEEILSMMETAVLDGTGKYAQVAGYSVGGKSGTSEPMYGNEEAGYIASFVGVSPVVNPEVVVLVIIHNPQGNSHQGSSVSGPVVSQILTEILPYLGVVSDNSTSTNSDSSVSAVPDVRHQTLQTAKSVLEKSGFNVIIPGSDDLISTLVIDQMPKPGISLIEDSTIYLYSENNNMRTTTIVPNFKNESLANAISIAHSRGLNVVLDGTGYVVSQDIAADKEVEKGTVITLKLQDEIVTGY